MGQPVEPLLKTKLTACLACGLICAPIKPRLTGIKMYVAAEAYFDRNESPRRVP